MPKENARLSEYQVLPKVGTSSHGKRCLIVGCGGELTCLREVGIYSWCCWDPSKAGLERRRTQGRNEKTGCEIDKKQASRGRCNIELEAQLLRG